MSAALTIPESVWGENGTKFEVTAGGCAIITLARPAKRNALSPRVSFGLYKALDECLRRGPTGTGEVRVAFLCAEGEGFCAGGDAAGLSTKKGGKANPDAFEIPPAMEIEMKKDPLIFGFSRLLCKFNELPVLTVALVQGAAYGGGVGLLACCDLVVAVADAQFSLSEVRLGMIPATISPYVIDKIGNGNSRRLFATGEAFDAVKAKEYGLVNEVVPDRAGLRDWMEKVCDMVTLNAPKAVGLAKDLIAGVGVRRGGDFLGLMDYTEDMLAKVRGGDEVKGGVMALMTKSKAPWTKHPVTPPSIPAKL